MKTHTLSPLYRRLMLLSLAMLTICAFSSQSWAGNGFGRGGGCMIMQSDRTLMLKDFSSSPVPSARQAGQRVRTGEMMKRMGVETLDVKTLAAYPRAVELIERWSVQSEYTRMLGMWLKEALTDLPLRGSPFRFHFGTPNCPVERGGRHVLAVHYEDWIGALLSLPVWDSLDMMNQTGLLIHEAWRSLQISLRSGMDESMIEQLTANIVFGQTPVAQLITQNPAIGAKFNELFKNYDRLVIDLQNACRHIGPRYSDAKVRSLTRRCETIKTLDRAWLAEVGDTLRRLDDTAQRRNPGVISKALEDLSELTFIFMSINRHDIKMIDAGPGMDHLTKGMRSTIATSELRKMTGKQREYKTLIPTESDLVQLWQDLLDKRLISSDRWAPPTGLPERFVP